MKEFKMTEYLQYNAPVVLTFFFISFLVLILNSLTKGWINNLLFSNYKSSLFSPLTYIRLFTHCLGHMNWTHFMNNFLYILLIGPMLEEKYGSINLLIMILITALITGIINSIIGKYKLLGASGIVFMFIILSSLVNIQNGKIPITLILIFLFYIANEIISGIFKKDNISHITHLIGAICGCIYGFYIL
jgi:membrane associated rhomboid family serine protease